MTKQSVKIYLTQEELKHFHSKADALGFSGKGKLSHYFSFISSKDLIVLDENTKRLLKALDLK